MSKRAALVIHVFVGRETEVQPDSIDSTDKEVDEPGPLELPKLGWGQEARPL